MSGFSDIEKFDRAVFDYLTTISGKIVYAPTSKALRTITKKEEFSDKKPWNFISFCRKPLFDVNWNTINNPGTVSGDMVRLREREDGNREARYVHNIPVDLSYSVDIWASKAREVQNLAIDLITKIYMTDQVLHVPINPDGESGRFHILDVSWEDTSEIERESEIGKVYRHSIDFTIDARLIMTRDVNTTKFCCVPVNIYEDYVQIL